MMYTAGLFISRHCEEQSDEAIQLFRRQTGLLRYARNDGAYG
jgi:hypothetical protein